MYLLVCLIYHLFHCTMGFDNECFRSSEEMISAVVGQDTILRCEVLENCPTYKWRISSGRGVYEDLGEGECSETFSACHEVNGNGLHVLRVRGIALNERVYYQCYCLEPSRVSSAFACLTLNPYIKLHVQVDGVRKVYGNSCEGPMEKYVIDTVPGQRISAVCPNMTEVESNCSAGSLESPFIVTKFHQDCYISCTFDSYCNVIATLNVLDQETITFRSTVGRKTTSEPKSLTTESIAYYVSDYNSIVIALVVIVIILLLVAVGLCVYLTFPKRNRQSKSTASDNFIMSSKSLDINSSRYACVSKDKDVPETFDPSASVKDILRPLQSHATVPPVNMNNPDDKIRTVTSNENHEKGTKSSAITRTDYETVDKTETQLRVQEMTSSIPEYAEVNKQQDGEVSVLYAVVDKKR